MRKKKGVRRLKVCGPQLPPATRLHPATNSSPFIKHELCFLPFGRVRRHCFMKAKKKKGIGERSEARRTEGDGSGELAVARGAGNKGSERSPRTRHEGSLACCLR